jgi:DMSO reductase anchor subunit
LSIPTGLDAWLGRSVAVCGVAAVGCSAMIYVSTRRTFWQLAFTGPKFLLTCLVLGLPAALGISLVAAALAPDRTVPVAFAQVGSIACWSLIVATTAKLALEAIVLGWLRAARFTPLKRTAYLMVGDLGLVTFQRFMLGMVGGIALPWFLMSRTANSADDMGAAWFLGLVSVLVVVVMAAGELIERYLFFTAVVAPKMPGVPAS